MRHSRILTLLATPLLAFSLAACDDDDGGTGIEGDELTQAETEVMTEVILSESLGTALGFGIFGGATFDRADLPGLTIAAETIDETFGPVTNPCEFGGDVTWAGSATGEVDEVTGAGDLNLSLEAVHDDCGVSDDTEDMVFFLTGDDRIASVYDFSFSETQVTIDGNTGGGVAWGLEDGRSGRCGIDVDYDYTITQTRVTGSMSGTVCGQDVSGQIDQPIEA